MNGNIYKISSILTDKCYIGSTFKDIEKRLRKHEYNFKAWNKGQYHYVSVFDILNSKVYKIELLENLKDIDVKELRKKEGFHIQNNNCVNKFLPGRTSINKKSNTNI